MREYKVLHLFAGIGGGALGFERARAEAAGLSGRYRTIGAVDFSEGAVRDFETLVGRPATCADLHTMTPDELRAACGGEAPDVVFTSPPCKGFSGLLSNAQSQSEKYQKLNELVLKGLWLTLETFGERPPRLILLENVPRIAQRGADLLRKVKALLQGYGYRWDERTHDCGEIGGLAQRRRRFLLAARHEATTPVLVYEPPTQRVRAVGEVLEQLPLPDDPAAGPLHRCPRLKWKTWVRLALVPAGGDWRSLGTTQDGEPWRGRYAVVPWDQVGGTVTGNGYPSGSGVMAVADPRFDCSPHAPSVAVTGGGTPTSGGVCVADPRIEGKGSRPDLFGVLRWDQPAKTISGSASVSGSNTPAAVADPRIPADDDRPDPVPMIIAEDGTWHRPLTTLELAALQSFPTTLADGSPLVLDGNSHTAWRERIGNAVPPDAAQAIAGSFLRALLLADAGQTFALGSTGAWVEEAPR